jgi:triosephosphate isomerase
MEKRRPLIAGNWKMFKSISESVEFVTNLLPLVSDSDIDIVVAPPFTSLCAVADIIKDSKINLSAQNMFWEKEGAFTGEVSPLMLISAGCRYVILGHSERRQYFGETDLTVNKKLKAATDSGLIPIMCIGETESQREEGKTFSVLDKQIKMGLEGLTLHEGRMLVIAYEPVWAIGTGKAATPGGANDVIGGMIRPALAELFSGAIAQAIRVQYGGSVTAANAAELFGQPEIDGALVGGASLKPSEFVAIVAAARG